MAQKSKKKNLTLEEKLQQALVPKEEQPYEIPGNWVWTKLGAILSVSSGKGLTAKERNTKGKIPVYGGNGITGYHDKNLVSGINIIIGRVGFYCGCVYYINEDAWVTDNAFLVNYNKTQIYSKYLFWLLLNTNLRINDSSSAQPVISGSKLYGLVVAISPRLQQQRIVAKIESLFEKLDRAKELAQSALDSFETQKTAILHKAFTGELTAKWRKENNIDIKEWKSVKLQDICTINPQKINVKNLPDNIEVTFIPMPSVSDILGIIINPQTKTLGEVRKGYTNFCENDIIFAKITPCMENGKCAVVGKLVNHIGFGSTEFHVLRCGEHLNNKFLYYMLRNQSFRDEAKAIMTGAVGQQRVSKSFLEEYPIYLPSLFEQQEIVRILDNLFAKEQRVKELCNILDKIDLIKKSILAKAFRGELGTNDPTEESAIELLKQCLKDDKE